MDYSIVEDMQGVGLVCDEGREQYRLARRPDWSPADSAAHSWNEYCHVPMDRTVRGGGLGLPLGVELSQKLECAGSVAVGPERNNGMPPESGQFS